MTTTLNPYPGTWPQERCFVIIFLALFFCRPLLTASPTPVNRPIHTRSPLSAPIVTALALTLTLAPTRAVWDGGSARDGWMEGWVARAEPCTRLFVCVRPRGLAHTEHRLFRRLPSIVLLFTRHLVLCLPNLLAAVPFAALAAPVSRCSRVSRCSLAFRPPPLGLCLSLPSSVRDGERHCSPRSLWRPPGSPPSLALTNLNICHSSVLLWYCSSILKKNRFLAILNYCCPTTASIETSFLIMTDSKLNTVFQTPLIVRNLINVSRCPVPLLLT